MRVGLGEDIHRLVEDHPLILAGVNIPFEKGLLGHSDADVVCHALSDALLGALALGDIGLYFPPSDPAYEGMDSRLILRRCLDMVEERGYRLVNADITIAAERPHLRQYIDKMRENLAKTMRISIDCVGIQAMSNEGMDAVGRGEAIKANAIVLVEK